MRPTLDEALEYVVGDELVEVRPASQMFLIALHLGHVLGAHILCIHFDMQMRSVACACIYSMEWAFKAGLACACSSHASKLPGCDV